MSSRYTLADLKQLMQRLRDPHTGCPWDVQQTSRSIAPSTLEEAYEVVDAIEAQDYPHLKEELGDLLFQVVFHSQMAAEQAQFDLDGVIDQLVAKLIRRHPHVFPAGSLDDTAAPVADAVQVQPQWESIKQAEREAKGARGVLADVPRALPALTRATKLQKRAARVGFDWPDIVGPIAKVREELAEVEQALIAADAAQIEEELGDLLFAVVNITRSLNIDAEKALRAANQKFERRFNYIETQLSNDLSGASLAQMDALWDEAKVRGL